jgi:hypothetical protein
MDCYIFSSKCMWGREGVGFVPRYKRVCVFVFGRWGCVCECVCVCVCVCERERERERERVDGRCVKVGFFFSLSLCDSNVYQQNIHSVRTQSPALLRMRYCATQKKTVTIFIGQNLHHSYEIKSKTLE